MTFPGVYNAVVDGVQAKEPVTSHRITRWISQFRKMRDSGIQIPIPWGHQSEADPIEDDKKDASKFHNSKFNASYIDALEQGPKGELILVAEVPPGMKVKDGALVDPKNHTTIREVSLAARTWTDGDGRTWEDAIRHIALTPFAVAHKTSGFRTTKAVAGEVRFSLADFAGTKPSTKSVEFAMADDAEEPKKKKPFPPEADADGEGDIDDLEGGGIDIEEIKAKLASAMNIKLPEDTNAENFLEHLWVAIHALSPDEPEELTTEAPPGGAGMGTMMSLLNDTNPQVRKLAERQLAVGKKQLGKRIEALVARGLKPAAAKLINDRATNPGLQMSIDDDGNAVAKGMEFSLSVLEAHLPAKFAYGRSGVQLSVADYPVLPDENKALLAEAKKRGEAMSTPSAKKTA